MTSEERHKAREERRKAKRAEKRRKDLEPYDNYDNVISSRSLYRAAVVSRHGVGWKASVQRYHINLLRNTWDLHRKLMNGENVIMGFICFDLMERGKLRHIRSVHFKERVVQRSLCDNALIPVLSRGLIYDNGASLEGKGIHFAMFRCRDYLRKYYRQHRTNEGWVLQIDFSGYFDNIQHAPIWEMLDRNFTDRRIIDLTRKFVESFGESSLGIGSQVSQILAITYPTRIDHYIAEVLRLKGERYMDDSIYFSRNREELEKALEILRPMYEAIGIRLNPRKTQIIPLRRFTFLKVRFELLPTGKVIMRPCRKSIIKQQQKLRKFQRFLKSGEMTLEDIQTSYESWRGGKTHMDGYKSIRRMDQRYISQFGMIPAAIKKKNRRKERDVRVR